MSGPTKLLTWPAEADAALAAWVARAQALGIPTTYTRPGTSKPTHSDSAAVRAAMVRATACRCEEHAKIDPDDPAIPRGPLPGVWHLYQPSRNPLRVLRERAGLTQPAAARKLRIARSTLSTYEHRPTVTAELLRRAKKAWTVK